MQGQPDPDRAGDAGRDPHFATTLARGLEILRCFTPDAVLLGNNQLASRTRLSRPTVSRFTYTLTQLGYLRTEKQPGKTRERTVYRLTDAGLEALEEYARTPVTFTPLKSDALLRLLIADLVGADVTRESLATLRDDVADLQERLDEARARADELPHRRTSLRIVADFLEELLELHLRLVDRVERELTEDHATT